MSTPDLKTGEAAPTSEAKPVDQNAAAAPVEAKAEAPVETKVDEAKNEAADKPDGELKPEEVLELKLPEGALLKPEHVAVVTEFAKANGLSNTQAQAILERDAAMAADTAKAQKEQFEQVVDTWRKQSSEDKEIGGEGFAANVEHAHRALKAYASPAFLKDLDASGYGNYPELVRVFSRIGKAMAEDKFVHSKNTPSERKNPAKVLYGN